MLPNGLNIKAQKPNEGLEPEDSDDSEDKPTRRNGRRKIKIEYIEDKNRRHITFSKRKAGIMKKAYELSTLTGTQVLLLVVSETGLVYTFTTTKLQPIVTKPEGKNLIQACLNTPDPEAPITNTGAMDSKSEENSTNYRQDNTTRDTNPLSPQVGTTASPSPQPTMRQPQPAIRPPGPKYPQYQQPPMPMPAAYNQRYLATTTTTATTTAPPPPAGYPGNMPPSGYPPYGQNPFYQSQSSAYPGSANNNPPSNSSNSANYWTNQQQQQQQQQQHHHHHHHQQQHPHQPPQQHQPPTSPANVKTDHPYQQQQQQHQQGNNDR
ncbi:Putative MADS-box transcription factor, other eukaryote [Rhizopus microsporus]|nr:Putative MADS-box transcription factor, other eukaryote [Rhizopus microsporus]